MNILLKNFVVVLCAFGIAGCGGGGSSENAAVTIGTPSTPQPSAEAHLQWNAPTLLVSGSTAAGNIASYNVYSLATGAATCPVDISLYVFADTVIGSTLDPQTYSDTGLVAGTYCFAITALNFSAQESVAAFLATPLTVS